MQLLIQMIPGRSHRLLNDYCLYHLRQDSKQYQAQYIANVVCWKAIICGIDESQKLTCYGMAEVQRGSDGEGNAMATQHWELRNNCKYKVCGK